jgi:uncharacterized membrane protein HdeD (DUF308 family)
MSTEISSEEAAIAEFSRAERRRKARVYCVGGIVALLLGVAAIVVAFAAIDPETQVRRFEVKALVAGVVLVLTGGSFLSAAWKIGTGRVLDVEYEVRR